MDDMEDVDVQFEERRRDGHVTVRVVPLKYVIWTASALFVLWNLIGFPLLDYYITRRLAEHNGDADSHAKLVNALGDVLRSGDRRVADELANVNERLARIEGALGVKK